MNGCTQILLPQFAETLFQPTDQLSRAIEKETPDFSATAIFALDLPNRHIGKSFD